MSRADLLFELGTEELPPKSLQPLSYSLRDSIVSKLQELGLLHGLVNTYATPRRLAVTIAELQQQQADHSQTRRGPSVQAPSKAIQGFAKSCDVDATDLVIVETEKGSYYQHQRKMQGAKTSALLGNIIGTAVAALPIAKRMRWGASRSSFVRPVHWFILLLGEQLVDASLFGLHNSHQSYGHRSHCAKAITINSASSYATQLKEQGYVIAGMTRRRAIIRVQLTEQARLVEAHVVIDEKLLDEVTSLVEWPVCLRGKFDEDFLSLPKEVLIAAMAQHQKCFHLIDDKDKILPYFITVSNIASRNPQAVIEGNQRVIRPRLADAAFFFNNDKKTPLKDHNRALEKVIFQADLGTVADKARRIAILASYIASNIGADSKKAQRAGELCKADLTTEVVLEFANLQGLMGHLYALNDGEDSIIAAAIEEHYWPTHAGDKLPTSLEASAVAIADRLDTLVGLFAIGQLPTGSKDPYALRRTAIGLLRIIIEKTLNLDVKQCIHIAYKQYNRLPVAESTVCTQLLAFIFDRLRAYYDERNISTKIYLAVSAANKSASLLDFDRRVQAVNHFLNIQSSASQLAQANKRVANILSKNGNGSAKMVPNLFKGAKEVELFTVLKQVQDKNNAAMIGQDYQLVLGTLAYLTNPLQAFFANTMVIVDDKLIRDNRLALLTNIQIELGRVADIALLAK